MSEKDEFRLPAALEASNDEVESLEEVPMTSLEIAQSQAILSLTSDQPDEEKPKLERSQTMPGAIAVQGIAEESSSPPVLEDTSETELRPTVTAAAVREEDLEREIRDRIITESVAAVAEPSKDQSPPQLSKKIVLLGLILCLLVVASTVAITLVVTSKLDGDDGDDDSTLNDIANTGGGNEDEQADAGSSTTMSENVRLALIQRIANFISRHSPDGGEALRTEGTPQYKAFNFTFMDMTPGDKALLDVALLDKYALATLYYSTGGPNWINNDYWLSPSVEPCAWWSRTSQSLGCDKKPEAFDLRGNNLQGTLPFEIVFASHSLHYLDLSNNNIIGTIPSEMLAMEELSTLLLDNNSLVGSLPRVPMAGQLFNFTEADAEAGWLDRFNVAPEDFTQFSVSNNKLTGTIPVSYRRLSLKVFDVQNNELTGPLPSTVGNWRRLKQIRLEGNLLNGTIPSSLNELDQLERGYFDGNNFSGEMPLCSSELNVLRLTADCEEVDCPCCTHCCKDNVCPPQGNFGADDRDSLPSLVEPFKPKNSNGGRGGLGDGNHARNLRQRLGGSSQTAASQA